MRRIGLDYDDAESVSRISVSESYLKANIAVHTKHGPNLTVSTAILSYHHEEFIVAAIESALEQKGDFHHEILLSDDGSTDGTARIMARYAEKYPRKIRNISRENNFGDLGQLSTLLQGSRRPIRRDFGRRRLLIDPEKNLKQAMFLREHPNAAMVHSRIDLLDMSKNTRRLLRRQDNLPAILSAADTARDENLNLIVNFSACMFRSSTMKQLPDMLYEPRLSEIALAFYLDRLGDIGFLSDVMTCYRVNDKSVWSGANLAAKHQQAIDVRECALRVARPIYRSIIQEHIDRKQAQLAAELAKRAA